jgi:hypothetical protein
MEIKFFGDHRAWAVSHGDRPVSINGSTFFEDREVLVGLLSERKLHVLPDGKIQVGGVPPSVAPAVLVSEEPPRKRGRPRLYSPEEARARRRESKRRSDAKRTDMGLQKESLASWRARNPDKVKQYRQTEQARRQKALAFLSSQENLDELHRSEEHADSAHGGQGQQA